MRAGRLISSVVASALIAGAALTACRSVSPVAQTSGPELDRAFIAPNVIYRVPPPRAIGATISAVQLVVARYRGVSFPFEVALELSPETLLLVTTDGAGRRGMTIEWSAEKLSFSVAPWLPARLRPQDVLAAMTIAYWPVGAVRSALDGTGATVEDSPSRRIIRVRGVDVVSVVYGPGQGWERSARLENSAFGFVLDVQSAELQ